MVAIEIDEKLRVNLIKYLSKLERRCRYVMDNPQKYSERARKSAGDTFALINPLLEALRSPVRRLTEEKISEDLKQRITRLENVVDALQATVKKLVAYHEGV